MSMIGDYFLFIARALKVMVVGKPAFYLWTGFLLVLVSFGGYAYSQQAVHGLIVTNLSDQVSWGAYIANFTFLVGVAADAVLLVVPAYIYNHKPTRDIVLLLEMLAVSAVIMCLLFIVVDLGRPDRFLHILPYVGKLNFPRSVLAWDVVVLNGYMFLTAHISGYLLFMNYMGRSPGRWIYLAIVFFAIFWAVSLHTVTAFLYSGLAGRPFWNEAILAPRFLVSALAGGPAILSVVFRIVSWVTDLKVQDGFFDLMKKIMAVTLPVNMFLLSCEIFKEFYTDSAHVASARYLFFGLHGAHMLQPYIWTAIVFETIAAIIIINHRLRDMNVLFMIACVMSIFGIWVEKGMGLIIPGFIPSPLGDIVEYTPSLVEFFVCLGIWALGALVYTLLAKVGIAVLTGRLKKA